LNSSAPVRLANCAPVSSARSQRSYSGTQIEEVACSPSIGQSSNQHIEIIAWIEEKELRQILCIANNRIHKSFLPMQADESQLNHLF
jgi:hypothetical protein